MGLFIQQTLTEHLLSSRQSSWSRHLLKMVETDYINKTSNIRYYIRQVLRRKNEVGKVGTIGVVETLGTVLT